MASGAGAAYGGRGEISWQKRAACGWNETVAAVLVMAVSLPDAEGVRVGLIPWIIVAKPEKALWNGLDRVYWSCTLSLSSSSQLAVVCATSS